MAGFDTPGWAGFDAAHTLVLCGGEAGVGCYTCKEIIQDVSTPVVAPPPAHIHPAAADIWADGPRLQPAALLL